MRRPLRPSFFFSRTLKISGRLLAGRMRLIAAFILAFSLGCAAQGGLTCADLERSSAADYDRLYATAPPATSIPPPGCYRGCLVHASRTLRTLLRPLQAHLSTPLDPSALGRQMHSCEWHGSELCHSPVPAIDHDHRGHRSDRSEPLQLRGRHRCPHRLPGLLCLEPTQI